MAKTTARITKANEKANKSPVKYFFAEKGPVITPKEAILVQCRFCLNTKAFRGCRSTMCKLNVQFLSSLKKIKAHCLDCITVSTAQAVRKCDGKVLNPIPHICSLHPYRLGHNPRRKGIGGRNPNSRGIFQVNNMITNAIHSTELNDKDEE